MPGPFGFDWSLRAKERNISVEDYRRIARRRLPTMIWSYVDGGADDLVTLKDNRDAYERWALLPRVLTGSGTPSLQTTIAGVPVELPLLLGPTGFAGLSRWDGDVAAARAAARFGTRYVLSTVSSWSIEEVKAASDAGHFFQLYTGTREISAGLMARAWNAGMRVLAVTVDSPAKGNREGERRHGMGIPPSLTPRRLLNIARHPRWAANVVLHQRIAGANLVQGRNVNAAVESVQIQQREFMSRKLDWDDFAWIRDTWKGFLYIKGILRPEEAQRAIELGANGVIVSNHGGRQLGSAPASLDALPAIAQAIGGRGEILIDGGVRRGSDVVKALALGANGVLIGRPYLYGLAAFGEEGIIDILNIFKHEIRLTLALIGVDSVDDVTRDHVVRRTVIEDRSPLSV